MTLCKIFFVVRSFTADSNLLQPTGSVNSAPHTSHFLVNSHLVTRTCVTQAQVWRAQRTFHIISCVIFMRSCCVFDSPRLLPFSSSCCLSSLLSSCFSSWPSISSSTVWWTNSQCTSACRVRPSHRVDIKLAQQKGLKFYQTRSNAIILHDTLPAYCIPKAVRMETGEVIYEKVYASPRPPPKIPFEDNWMKKLDSEVARQPEGEVARQAKSSQSTQPIQTQIMIERRDPLFALKEERPVLKKPKHVSLVTARTSIQKKKQITIERGDPLFAVMQIMSAQC